MASELQRRPGVCVWGVLRAVGPSWLLGHLEPSITSRSPITITRGFSNPAERYTWSNRKILKSQTSWSKQNIIKLSAFLFLKKSTNSSFRTRIFNKANKSSLKWSEFTETDIRWAPYMITQPSKWGSEVGVTSYLEREVERGFGRTCNVLRVAGQGKTWSWQGAQGGFEFPPASPTFSCCKLCLGSPNGSLNSQCESQAHLGASWPSSRPPQDIIAEGSPPPALAEIPWLLVIVPARVPAAQKCCLVLPSHSTRLSEFYLLPSTHSGGVKKSTSSHERATNVY